MQVFVQGSHALTPCLLGIDRTSDRLCLNERLEDKALKVLVRSGLEKRFPEQCRQWKENSNAIKNMPEFRARAQITNVSERLRVALPRLLFEAALDEVMRLYP